MQTQLIGDIFSSSPVLWVNVTKRVIALTACHRPNEVYFHRRLRPPLLLDFIRQTEPYPTLQEPKLWISCEVIYFLLKGCLNYCVAECTESSSLNNAWRCDSKSSFLVYRMLWLSWISRCAFFSPILLKFSFINFWKLADERMGLIMAFHFHPSFVLILPPLHCSVSLIILWSSTIFILSWMRSEKHVITLLSLDWKVSLAYDRIKNHWLHRVMNCKEGRSLMTRSNNSRSFIQYPLAKDVKWMHSFWRWLRLSYKVRHSHTFILF